MLLMASGSKEGGKKKFCFYVNAERTDNYLNMSTDIYY